MLRASDIARREDTVILTGTGRARRRQSICRYLRPSSASRRRGGRPARADAMTGGTCRHQRAPGNASITREFRSALTRRQIGLQQSARSSSIRSTRWRKIRCRGFAWLSTATGYELAAAPTARKPVLVRAIYRLDADLRKPAARSGAEAELRDEAAPTVARNGTRVAGTDAERFFPRFDGGEMWSRWDMQDAPPDILITNYSMLNIMLMRDVEAPIFDMTRPGLLRIQANVFHLVVDELHTYRGTPGTEVGYILRVLYERLGLNPDHPQLRIIASSASLGERRREPRTICSSSSAARGASPLCRAMHAQFPPDL